MVRIKMGIIVNDGAQKKNLVYGAVFADIVRNVYDLSSIITEKMIIDKYQVSKSPVREALQELCNDSILESIPRLGYRVRPVSIKEMIDATNFRIIIEVAALERSMPFLTDDKIKKLEDIYVGEKTIESTKDPYIHWDMNTKFHLLLCSYSDNIFFTNTLKTLMRSCFRGVNYYFEQSFIHDLKREDSKMHASLLAALKKRDFEESKRIIIADIEDFKSDFVSTAIN